MYLDFDNSVCTCLAKSNMDILFILQDCTLPVRSSSDRLIFPFSILFFIYVCVCFNNNKKTYFCNSVPFVLT